MNLWLGHPHNLFLMFGAETGIISLLLFLAIIAVIMFLAIKQFSSSSQEFDLVIFSYLVAFTAYILFNLTDVTIFDLRVNTIAWILLAAISGVTNSKLSKPKIN
jgi:O-antigen ligase